MTANGTRRAQLSDVEAVIITSVELAKNGPGVRAALNAAYGGELDASTTNLLYGELLHGTLTGWALVGCDDSGRQRMCGLLLGRVIDDPLLGRHLYLPAMNVAASVPLSRYGELFEQLVDFARIKGCRGIWFQTESKAAVALGEHVGFRRHSVVMRRDI